MAMSGHSKWSTIKHKKGAADAKRGKIFTKHAKLIEIAAREGNSGDPTMNTALANAIYNAKADNVPNENIDRAIKKGTGELKGEQMSHVLYECYGPGGIACIIECLTDNKNRSLSNVRSIIEKRGGKWAESNSVAFMFTRKGVIVAKATVNDDVELELIEAGADTIEKDGEMIHIQTEGSKWTKVRDVLVKAKAEIQEAGLQYVANQHLTISDVDSAQKVVHFIEAIEEDDDVSEVHSNADIDSAVLEQLQ